MTSFSVNAARLAGGLLVLGLLALGGCTMAPKYVRPDAPIPNDYRAGAGPAGPDMVPWTAFIRDPGMQQVVETALVNNRDLRVAMLNIERTRAQYRIQRADLLPTVSAVASETAQRIPGDISGRGVSMVQHQYSASLGFSSFELDLFGRIRSLTDQALETYYSVEDDARTARLSLVAETAAMYLQLVADRELLDITRSTYENRKKQYDLIQSRFNAGVASQLEVSQAKTVMEEARSNLARYETLAGQDENYLGLLMGYASPPAGLPQTRRLADVVRFPDVPEGLPSQLLERRPDVLSAEHLLRGANANIGAARANFFPTISLTGSWGTTSTDLDNLFTGPAKAWSFIPQISLPIFDTGRNIARMRVAQAERDIAVAQYEKAVQNAFREVSDALVQRLHMNEQVDADTSLLQASTQSFDLASLRYNAGIDDYLTLLDSQRTLYGAQQTYISTMLLREVNALTLYKALGGGWQ